MIHFPMVRRIVAATFTTACALSASATGLESLEAFVKTVKSGRADFTQMVIAPAKDGQTRRAKNSTGTFEFARPNRFKFLYKKPFEQSIVADGQTLWLFDVDLNQVTARKQSQAALIAAAPDLRTLQTDFTLANAPDADGLQWVSAIPKAKDSQLQNVRVGFRAGGKTVELAVLEILDSFGQKSVLNFHRFEVNALLSEASFQFKPPVGADVIWQ
jgi:outer membrane lipoprotein carrier protein